MIYIDLELTQIKKENENVYFTYFFKKITKTY